MTTTYPEAQPETVTAPQPSVAATPHGKNDSVDEAAVPAPTVISLKDVSFYYGAFRAVKEVSFDVPAHQITSLIGPSGCGKSTLLRTINRMNDLIAGHPPRG